MQKNNSLDTLFIVMPAYNEKENMAGFGYGGSFAYMGNVRVGAEQNGSVCDRWRQLFYLHYGE